MDDTRAYTIRTLVEPILAEQGIEIVEFSCRPQGGQLAIRVLVDAVGGVTIQRCARANQRITQAIEASQAVPEAYSVEVSSPGLDRPLTVLRDYERAIGEQLLVASEEPDGKVRDRKGMLLAVQPEAVVLKTAVGNLTIPFDKIRTAKKALPW